MAIIHGFQLKREQDIKEMKTRARFFGHVRTGAELLSLTNDDENKVFGIIFRTPPPDSTGVTHILEHSVLCGVRKYPMKEPFFMGRVSNKIIQLAKENVVWVMN